MVVAVIDEAPAAATLSPCIAPKSKSHKRHKEGTSHSYCKIYQLSPHKVCSENVIGKKAGNMMHFTQRSNKYCIKWVKILWAMHSNATEYMRIM